MTLRALGIDVGTTSLKAVVVDEAGRVVASASARYATRGSAAPGVVERDPGEWTRALREALAGLDPRILAGIDAIGLSGNMSSVVLVDAAGTADGPAILLADGRGAEQIAALPAGTAERIRATSGNDPAVVFSLSTLLWLAAEHPERLRSGTAVAAKDWLRMQLCGTGPESEITDAANTLLVDRYSGDWDTGLAVALGIPVSALPPLRRSDEVVGRSGGSFGLPAGVPVVAGGGDMACLALGGGFGGAAALVSLGTSMTVLLPATDDIPGTSRHLLFDEGEAFRLCSLVTGGLALNWLGALTGARLAELPPTVLAADDPLVVVPHLAGSAFPEMRPGVRGGILGLGPEADADALAAALFEGLAFELSDAVASGRGVAELVLTGGGVQVPAWTAAIAETLGAPVSVLVEAEASARGAALLGLRGIGAGDAARTAPERIPLTADPARTAARAARRERYLAARELVFRQQEPSDCDGDPR